MSAPGSGRVRLEIREGLRDILPVLCALAPMAVLFGTLAAAKGLSALQAGLMTLLVNAGTAQFAALALWHRPLPAPAILLTTLLINCRLSLMALSMARRLAPLPRPWRYLAIGLLVDAAWILAERRVAVRPVSLAYWLATALPFLGVGALATVAGAALGNRLGDPRRIGADFAFTALLMAWTAGPRRPRAQDLALLAAAAAALAGYRLLGPPWHVPCGTVVGLGVALVAAPGSARRARPA